MEWGPFFSQLVLAFIIVIEFAGIFSGMRANIDHFSHLGGYFIGIWSAGALTWKAENQSARETSRKSAELERQERELVERRKAEWRAPPPVDKKEIVR